MKIKNSPIKPKPSVSTLEAIFDWKSFIEPRLAGGSKALKNHTMFHSFKWSKEDDLVPFRAKPLPQDDDEEFAPKQGLQLVDVDINWEFIKTAEFRIEKLELEKVFNGLKKYFKTLEGEEKMEVVSSWDKFRDRMEKLPRKRTLDLLGSMTLDDLPRQEHSESVKIPSLEAEINHPTLEGESITVDAEKGDVCELRPGTEVCVYSVTKHNRPWIGVISQVKSRKQLKVHWFENRVKGKFCAMKDKKGRPVESDVSADSIMFWSMANKVSCSEMELSGYWIKKIQNEYSVLDKSFN